MEDLVAGYPGRVLVRNFFLCLPAPAFVAVVGHNGSGKTTLFRVLTGQLLYQGSARLLGQEVRGLRQAAAAVLLGYLPQRGSIGFSIAVRELVVMGRYRHHGLLSAYALADYALADAALARVGMAHLAARDFTQLSGGEQQLVWLAQLSLQDSQVYLLDERARPARRSWPRGWIPRCSRSMNPPSSSTCTTAARCLAWCMIGWSGRAKPCCAAPTTSTTYQPSPASC